MMKIASPFLNNGLKSHKIMQNIYVISRDCQYIDFLNLYFDNWHTGGLPSMGSQRVGHDSGASTHTHAIFFHNTQHCSSPAFQTEPLRDNFTKSSQFNSTWCRQCRKVRRCGDLYPSGIIRTGSWMGEKGTTFPLSGGKENLLRLAVSG